MRNVAALYAAVLLAPVAGCGGGFGEIDLPDEPPQLLSELQLVRADEDGSLLTNDRVEPYALNTPLFSDYALKERLVYVPDGEVATPDPRSKTDALAASL